MINPHQRTVLLAVVIVGLSCLILSYNYWVFHFVGNAYILEACEMTFVLSLIYLGLSLTNPSQKNLHQLGQHFVYLSSIVLIILLAGAAVQLTPFEPIDSSIVAFEHTFHLHLPQLLIWVKQHPVIEQVLDFSYFSLNWQIHYIPLLLLILCQFHRLNQLYFLLLLSTFIGFSIYFFLPTTAPASMFEPHLFSESQRATGIKFWEIHQHHHASTQDGGLIAFPSFHVIWACLCTYSLKDWPIICLPLACLNVLLILSCVLLGWHYISDVVASFLILLISYYCLQQMENANRALANIKS